MKDIILNLIYETTILIIDDDLYFLNKLKNLLINEGFKNVISASSFLDIKEELNKKPDLIIMEYEYSNFTSESIVELIHQVKFDLKWIVTSKSRDVIISFKSISDGALTFIHKNEKNWEHIMIDSVTAWINYLNCKKTRKTRYDEIAFA